ncbi:MAG: hypothetical protein LLF90_12440 [Methanomicrobiaceae archaeon]|nr:hypothetical protein [Methanomicrobiaceae archaeon]
MAADYPFEPAKDALVFLSSHHRALKHGTAMNLLNTTACRAGIGRHIAPEEGETERPLQAIQCPHRIVANPPGSKYCLRCGLGIGGGCGLHPGSAQALMCSITRSPCGNCRAS